MKRGFMNFVVTRLIPDSPGQTAKWYARKYLELGDDLSDAESPDNSLANTLSKQVCEGREPRVRREQIGGVYRYFPVSGSPTSNLSEEVVAQISLSMQELEDIDNLIAVDKFRNRNAAIKWLVTEGIKANRDYLNRVADVRRQIEQIKSEIT